MSLFNFAYIKRRKIYLPDNYQKSLAAVLRIITNLNYEAIRNKEFQTFALCMFSNSKNIPYAIYNFVRNNISYVSDQYDETIISPLKILGLKYGDCDDMALLVKSFLDVMAIPSNFMLLGKRENEYTHIVVRTKDDIIIDPTNRNFNDIPDSYKFSKII